MNNSEPVSYMTWGAGWTHLVPYWHGSRPHFIAYNKTSGLVHYDKILYEKQPGQPATFQGLEILLEGHWHAGWTHVVPVAAGTGVDIIVYNKNTGQAKFASVKEDGTGLDIRWEGTWHKDWSHLWSWSRCTDTSGSIGGQSWTTHDCKVFFGVYNAATGQYKYFHVLPDGTGYENLFEGAGSTGWTHVMPFHFKGLPHLMFYNRESGHVHLHYVSDALDLNIKTMQSLVFYNDDWETGWRRFMPFESPSGESRFLMYNSTNGAARIGRFVEEDNPYHPNGYHPLEQETWEQGLGIFMPFYIWEQPHEHEPLPNSPEKAYPYAIIYHPTTCQARIQRMFYVE